MNASIYAYSPVALKNKSPIGFFNSNCTAFMMKDTAVLDIDSEEDYELMQLLAGYFYDHYPDYAEIRDAAKGLMVSTQTEANQFG
jgi:CMP-N,N'-diacetyllegionaminic acid synthase